jgi:NAD(P)H-hydrate epimerase
LDDYKYSAGKVLTIAGSGKLPGAACYTANSAIYGGAGASLLAFPESVKSVAQDKLESSIVESYDDEGKEYLSPSNLNELQKLIKWADSIALGPGLGREKETINAVREIITLAKGKRVVIDADALFAISDYYFKKLNLRGMILTPHQQEFARLINVELKQLQNNLINYGKKFSKETKAYLVLKGAPTIIFTPSGDALINTTGNPGMATFGSGDVLTGLITAFIAKSEKIEDGVVSAVYVHSLAADLLLEEINEAGVTADLIMKNIPKTIKFIEDSIVKSSF